MNKTYKNKYLKYKSKYRTLLMNLDGGMNKEDFDKIIKDPKDEDFTNADKDNNGVVTNYEYRTWLKNNPDKAKDTSSENKTEETKPEENESAKSTEEPKPTTCMTNANDVANKIKTDDRFAGELEKILKEISNMKSSL